MKVLTVLDSGRRSQAVSLPVTVKIRKAGIRKPAMPPLLGRWKRRGQLTPRPYPEPDGGGKADWHVIRELRRPATGDWKWRYGSNRCTPDAGRNGSMQ